ncbi:CU044_5270 family protein [Streptomyces sp. NK08204]|uniref:CU044_5270 family protein n=1 Tax=Streptomyces sp. NK08204 TaxID=2873260 RepID=UPI001CECC323|nr:CU044_5270 family protein [Streptomyces sp. NK08204]
MTQPQDLLDFPGAESLRAAGRVEPPAPQAVARALAAVEAATRQESARHSSVVPLRRRSLTHGRRIVATALAIAAAAAGVVVYGVTGTGSSGGRTDAAPRPEAVTAATVLDRTATVAAARPASSAPYWKMHEKISLPGRQATTADLYFSRSMHAYIVAGGQTHKKQGTFNWRLGPKALTWNDLNRLPTDPAALLSLMNSSKEYAGQSAFLQAGNLLGGSPASPGLRAGLYRALAHIQGVKLVGTVKDSAGRTGTELVFNGVASSDRLVIDPKTSALLETVSVTTKGTDSGATSRVTYLSVGPADRIG